MGEAAGAGKLHLVFLLFQIKIVGIVNRTHIQIQENPSGIRILFQTVQDEINLVYVQLSA